jgi:hypothetical protein
VISDDDLPALFRQFDRTAVEAQRKYLRFFALDLGLIVLAAVTAFIPYTPQYKVVVIGLTLTFLFAGMLITIVLTKRGYEKLWYGARAGAESVKTLAWRYMMRAKPFDTGSDAEVDETFGKALRDVLEAKKESAGGRVNFSNARQITETMKKTRMLSTADRKKIYLESRIEEQDDWYSRKAQANADRAELWFNVVILCQLLAFVACFVQYADEKLPLMVGVFAAASSSALAWLQARRYQELAQSYSVTAHDLSLAAVGAPHKNTDSDLAHFVAEAESAVSREHTMWISRRAGS